MLPTRHQARVPDAGVSGGTVVPVGSVGVRGKVRVPDVFGVVRKGVFDRAGSPGTGGPMREAGAVGSAAAGRPGVWAKQAPASMSDPAVMGLESIFMMSPCVAALPQLPIPILGMYGLPATARQAGMA
jgi:hypothetical protein